MDEDLSLDPLKRDNYLADVYRKILSINPQLILIYSKTRCSIGINAAYNGKIFPEFDVGHDYKKSLPPGYQQFYHVYYNKERTFESNSWFNENKLKPYLERIIQTIAILSYTSKILLNVSTERAFLDEYNSYASLDAMIEREANFDFKNINIAREYNSYDCDMDTYADPNKIYRFVHNNLYSNNGLIFCMAKRKLQDFKSNMKLIRFVIDDNFDCLKTKTNNSLGLVELVPKLGYKLQASKKDLDDCMSIIPKVKVLHWQKDGIIFRRFFNYYSSDLCHDADIKMNHQETGWYSFVTSIGDIVSVKNIDDKTCIVLYKHCFDVPSNLKGFEFVCREFIDEKLLASANITEQKVEPGKLSHSDLIDLRYHLKAVNPFLRLYVNYELDKITIGISLAKSTYFPEFDTTDQPQDYILYNSDPYISKEHIIKYGWFGLCELDEGVKNLIKPTIIKFRYDHNWFNYIATFFPDLRFENREYAVLGTELQRRLLESAK